jgi:acyl-CoA thioesterase-1
MKNILFFGDSLTAGYGLLKPGLESFPAQIGQKIEAAGLDYTIINAGMSGDTSGGGLARVDYWTHQPIQVFVLELGINDIIRGISPQTTLKNLQLIIEKVKVKHPNVKIALMGMHIPAFVPTTFAVPFNAIYRRLAEMYKLAYVPFFLDGVAGKLQYNLPDHLHPNAEGYKIIADKVWPVIKNLLVDVL